MTSASPDFNSHGWFESLVTDQVRFSGLNARIHLFGTMNAPSVTVIGDLANLESQKDGLSLSGRFDLSYTNKGIIIRQFQWQGGPGQLIAVTGTIPVNFLEKPLLRPGPLSVDARISIPDLSCIRLDFSRLHTFRWRPSGQIANGRHLEGTVWNVSFQKSGLKRSPALEIHAARPH